VQYDNQKVKRRWRRKQLAEYWGVSCRTVDRMARDGRLGLPKYIGAMPTWGDEQREAAERDERIESVRKQDNTQAEATAS
jgi:hypothetical protein